MRVSTLGLAEIPKLKKLHDKVYNRDYPYRYFAYLFKNPMGIVPLGMFDGKRLIGFYCGELRKYLNIKTAICTIAMTDPDYRGQGLFIKLATILYAYLKQVGCKFISLFANENIVNIYEKYLDFKPIKLKKYWTDINSKHFHPDKFIRIYESQDNFKNYRFLKHPTKKYEMYLDTTSLNNLILNKYDNQMQMIHFSRLTPRIIEKSIMHGSQQKCQYLTTFYKCLPGQNWLGKDIDLWFCYKHLAPEFPNWETKILDDIRMGMTDTY